MKQKPPFVAHRGHMVDLPENSLPAISYAIEQGCGYIEFDLQLSKDGVPMIYHDATLVRTSGREAAVWELDSQELQQISAGEPEKFGEQFSAINIPTLAAGVDLLNRTPDVTAFIELKRSSLRQFGAENFLAVVRAELKLARFAAIVISYDYAALQILRSEKWSPVGWVVESIDAETERKVVELAPDYLFINITDLPPDGVPWLGAWRWVAFDLRDPDGIETLLAQGVELIESGCVERLIAAWQSEVRADG